MLSLPLAFLSSQNASTLTFQYLMEYFTFLLLFQPVFQECTYDRIHLYYICIDFKISLASFMVNNKQIHICDKQKWFFVSWLLEILLTLLLAQTSVLYMFHFLFINRKHLLAWIFPLKKYFQITGLKSKLINSFTKSKVTFQSYSVYIFSFCASRLNLFL